jgi:hypothetical protein
MAGLLPLLTTPVSACSSARLRATYDAGDRPPAAAPGATMMSTLGRWRQVKFAGPLKSMCMALGLTEAHIEGHLKEVPCELLCGQTPRHAMQTLGTE